MSLGIDIYKRTDDRRVLEQIILPYFAKRKECVTVLFVGCDWYTRGYRRIFDGKNFWTLEIDPKKKCYGAKLHIVDSVTNVTSHFRENELDLIVCNGVVGFGLNEIDEFDKAIHGCFVCLRQGGSFVLGWNDTPWLRPFPLDASTSLRKFSRSVFPPLAAFRVLTANPNRHTYDFYARCERHDRQGDF